MPHCIFCDHDNPSGVAHCQSCDAPLPSSQQTVLPEDVFHRQLKRLISENQRAVAIVAYCRRADVDEASATEAIDALERGSVDLESEIIDYLERDEKIAAIKLYRVKTGLSLKDAKDAVEAIAQRKGLSPARTSTGCFGGALLLCGLLTSVVCLLLRT